jgi:hypothetical protein
MATLFEALILLGKVEYYLGHSAAPRRSFEIALSYEPGNTAAFFGIEYHRQRTGRLFLGASVLLLLAAIGLAAAFLMHRMTSFMRQVDARLDATFAELSGSVDRSGSAIEELRPIHGDYATFARTLILGDNDVYQQLILKTKIECTWNRYVVGIGSYATAGSRMRRTALGEIENSNIRSIVWRE